MNWDDLDEEELLSRFLQLEERIDKLEEKLIQKNEQLDEPSEMPAQQIGVTATLGGLTSGQTTGRTCNILRISPMETLLPGQTTAGNKMITPSRNLLFSQPEGGRNVSAVRSLSSDS